LVKEAIERFAVKIAVRKSDKNWSVLRQVLKMLPSLPNAVRIINASVIQSSTSLYC